MAIIRTALLAVAIGASGAALLPSPKAEAWWARPGVWVAGPRRPVVVYAPPRPYYYRHWVPAHVDYWGRWHPGHWI